LFVLVDDLSGSFLVVEWVENLVESRIALFVVEKINKGRTTNRIRLALCAATTTTTSKRNSIIRRSSSFPLASAASI
jgi:hypothetical protein